MTSGADSYDVIVVGGGNAALCAAITARAAGRSVLLLECAPQHFRGGNSRHTRNLRCMHDAPEDMLTGAYPEEEYWQDLLKVTDGQTNEHLARATIRSTANCRQWMHAHGVRFQPALGGTLGMALEAVGLENRQYVTVEARRGIRNAPARGGQHQDEQECLKGSSST